MDAQDAYRLIHDELALDGNPELNLATFVTTYMDDEADRLMAETANKNAIDWDEYPQVVELQDRCVNMLSRLYHAHDHHESVGTATVGSSEAIHLGGLAMKWRWRKAREAAGLPADRPNLVMGQNVQVCWEKFARYFDVEPRYVPLTDQRFVIGVDEAMAMVDENTIGVVGILGSTYNGEYEPIAGLNRALDELCAQRGWDIPIHVDAASGGFVAPFLQPGLEWDFSLSRVRSINVSGHKYGLVYPGVGWIIWRDRSDLPDELIFTVDYLGGSHDNFGLNFSRGAAQIVAQYYNFIRLGRKGYRDVMVALSNTARGLADQIESLDAFQMYGRGEDLPVVCFGLPKDSPFTVFQLSDHLRQRGLDRPGLPHGPRRRGRGGAANRGARRPQRGHGQRAGRGHPQRAGLSRRGGRGRKGGPGRSRRRSHGRPGRAQGPHRTFEDGSQRRDQDPGRLLVPTLRFGILGAARIAPAALVRPARRSIDVEVGAVAARDSGKAKAFAAKHDIARVASTYDALLADPEVDAVYNPLPNGLHGRWTLAALAAGKHVLCEKPFTADAAEARTVAAVTATSGLVVMEAFHYRYHPLAARVAAVVASGELGSVRRIEVSFSAPLLKPGDIRYRLDLAGGALMDMGCYTVSFLRLLAGAEPTVVSARAKLSSPGVDRAMRAEFTLPDGATGAIRCSMCSSSLLAMHATVEGEGGTLRVFNPFSPQFGHRLRVETVAAGRRTERVTRRATYDFQLDAFASAVVRGTPVLTTPEDAVRNMAVIDDVYRAAGMEPRRPSE